MTDLQGVGETDHYIRLSWRLGEDISINRTAHGMRLLQEIIRFGLTRSGSLSLPAGILAGFVRSREGLGRIFNITSPMRVLPTRPSVSLTSFPA